MSKYSVGLRNVGSYQVSGTPWITGSTIVRTLGTGQGGSTVVGEFKIKFPKVTESISVKLKSGGNSGMFLGFQSLANMGITNTTTPGTYPQFNITSHHMSNGSDEYGAMGFLLEQGDTQKINVGVKEIYLWTYAQFSSAKCDFEVVATLTNIPTGSMYELTGAGITTITT